MERRTLLYGIQSFESVKTQGLYIDKTAVIYKMIRSQVTITYFYARPRRFGKSLTVSTLQAVFEGKKELFEGTALYNTDYDWTQTYPVIRLDFGIDFYFESGAKLREALLDHLELKFSFLLNEHLIYPKYTAGLGDYFFKLILKTNEIYGKKIVILIDEYDSYLLKAMNNPELYPQVQDVLREFYSTLKPAEEYIRFTYITGLSRFSKLSIFSKLNNLKDITMSPEYDGLTGFTQEEVEHYLGHEIDRLTQKLKFEPQRTKELLKKWFNGYRWGGDLTVYNPIALMICFEHLRLGSYWFSEAESYHFFLKAPQLELQFAEGMCQRTYTEVELLTGDPFNMNPLMYLWQLGYLGVADILTDENGRPHYRLDFPNYDVKEAFTQKMVQFFLSKRGKEVAPLSWGEELKRAFEETDVEKLEKIFNELVLAIPYQIHNHGRHKTDHQWEGFYHSLFYIAFLTLGMNVRVEVSSRTGSRDLTIFIQNKWWIFEFKHRPDLPATDLAQTALTQILEKKYAVGLAQPGEKILIGVGIGLHTDGEPEVIFQTQK